MFYTHNCVTEKGLEDNKIILTFILKLCITKNSAAQCVHHQVISLEFCKDPQFESQNSQKEYLAIYNFYGHKMRTILLLF